MGLIPQDVLDRVLAAHDIVEVVGRYVSLKSAGRTHKGLCPFHEEKTPSFTVSPERQTFKCFGCGKGGNAFRFLMEHEGMTFREAVRLLARERGIPVPETGERSPEERGRTERAHAALAFAHAFFQKALASDAGSEARAYLARRGYDDAAQRRFRLGYAPMGWDRLLQAAGARKIPLGALEDAGLVVRREESGRVYDRFRHRVVFPIADLRGRVVTFGARALSPEDQPKYLNGPETPVFRKSEVLYALDRAREPIRRTGEALLMEGYTDVLMCHLCGFDRAVAGMGTAFTSRQANLLKRFARRVALVYDADAAGQAAAERTLDVLLEEELEVRAVLLPEGRDVDEILIEEGGEALDRLLADALDVVDFKLHVLGHRHDLATPEGRAAAGEALAATLGRIPGPVARDQWLRAAAERLGGTGVEAALRLEAGRQLRAAASRGGAPAAGSDAAPEGGAPRAPGVLARARRDEQEFLLAGVVGLEALRGRIFRAMGAEDFTDPAMRRLYNACLSMDERGEPITSRSLNVRFAEDGEVQEVLAGLCDDEGLEERLTVHVEYLESRRRLARRREDLLAELEQAVERPRSESPGAGSSSSKAPDFPSPSREQDA